jgi:hypothetical protein
MKALKKWFMNLAESIDHYVMRYHRVVMFHKVVGVMCGVTLFAIIASQTGPKQACPDTLFYYQACSSVGWLNVMIAIVALLSEVVCLFQMFMLYRTTLDRYVGAALLLANMVFFILLALTSVEIIHYEVVYFYSFVLMVLNGWLAFSALFAD